jgi:hypothetical protein
MKTDRKTLIKFAAIFLAAIIILTLFIAPQNNKTSSGSTYGRSPDGYSAWYTFMADRGTPVTRWRKSFKALKQKTDSGKITLLKILPNLSDEVLDSKSFPSGLPDNLWIQQGNNLVILGAAKPPTPANFNNTYNHELGTIKIDTTRREKRTYNNQILGDKFGSVIWSESMGKGKIIYSTTPYLGANAYQDFSGNYELLAKLVTESKHQILVDEYIHGYKDAETIAAETAISFTDYLAKTPLFPVFIQVLIVLVIAVLAQNFRFGQPETLTNPTVDNSAAYIQALGGVLQKAEESKFVVEIIDKAERQKLQRSLGLGDDLVKETELIEAWKQQTGKPIRQLQEVILEPQKKQKLKESDLVVWLEKWREIHRYFSN